MTAVAFILAPGLPLAAALGLGYLGLRLGLQSQENPPHDGK